MAYKIKWGIMGLGKIAHKLASDLQLSSYAELYGVASRDEQKAKDFGAKHNAAKCYGSYEELTDDPEVDVIYIATPHVFHFENAMLCLKNGKHVLGEKPMGMNAKQVEAMIAEAKSRNLFLMEGIWTRFIPATEKLIELLNQKIIGDILFVRADFGFTSPFNPEGRLYNKKLGGGALLDIGIYPIYFSLLTLGIPTRIQASARMTPTGVDSYCAMLFDYANKTQALLDCTLEADTPTEAYIYGSKGHIKIHNRFHHPEKLSLYRNKELVQEIEIKHSGFGYLHEIEEVNHCIKNNLIESPKLPHAMSSNLVSVMDQVRREIGLVYDSD
ncbi:MAG: Gfo/Idh/MocA family oxidoreductase [Cyclobacteriaceae bacterium]|nr:Gfo/Idh/MocA family oxidoreductase [Cyclobacteriaceae bacterium]